MADLVHRLEPRVFLAAVLVEDIRPGTASSSAWPHVAAGDTVYFTAPINGRYELWKSGGTAANTDFVKPLPTRPSYDPTDWAAANGRAFFIVPNLANSAHTLWATDGTDAGTLALHEIFWQSPGNLMPPSDPDHVVPAGDKVYFLHRASASSLELWKSNGTPAGTTRVKAFANSDPNADFSGVDVNGTFYFKLNGELWKTSGTDAGTTMLDLSPGAATSFLHSLTNVNGTLFFAGTLTRPSGQRWGGVFRSDGTVAGTQHLAAVFLDVATFEMEAVGDSVYFQGSATDPRQLELWKYDPATGAAQVADVFPGPSGSQPAYLTKVGDDLFFFAHGGFSAGSGLWTTDGTAAGTRILKQTSWVQEQAPYAHPPGYAAEGHGKFLALTRDRQLLVSDGTAGGTLLVQNAGPYSVLVRSGNGDVYFGAYEANVTGNELWRYAADATVVARHIFYRTSIQADWPNRGIDPTKRALLPGETATFANVTSSSHGINGIFVDVAGLPDVQTTEYADFEIRTAPALGGPWSPGPAMFYQGFRRGEGVGGSDRIHLWWIDHDDHNRPANERAIANGWLEVTVKPSSRTGLIGPDVFYVGNRIGDTGGGSPSQLSVDARDVANTRAAMSTQPVSFSSRYDFNRDGYVNARDVLIARAAAGKRLLLGAAPTPTSPATVASAPEPATALVRRRGDYAAPL